MWPSSRHLKYCFGPRLGSNTRVKADSPSTSKYLPSRSFTASARFVTYTTIDPYAFSESFRLSYESLAIFTPFSFSSISVTPARNSPFSSRTATLHALSTLTGYHWSRRTRAPLAFALSATALTRASSSSFRHVMRMPAVLRGSLVTATQRQPLPPSPFFISFSISCLIVLAFALSLSSSSTLDTSTLQHSVSVKVDGVVWLESVL